MSKTKKEKGKLIVTADILVLDEIALAITQISEAFKRMNDGPLHRRALVVLIQDKIGSFDITKKQINQVLDATTNLDDYLKKTN